MFCNLILFKYCRVLIAIKKLNNIKIFALYSEYSTKTQTEGRTLLQAVPRKYGSERDLKWFPMWIIFGKRTYAEFNMYFRKGNWD